MERYCTSTITKFGFLYHFIEIMYFKKSRQLEQTLFPTLEWLKKHVIKESKSLIHRSQISTVLIGEKLF